MWLNLNQIEQIVLLVVRKFRLGEKEIIWSVEFFIIIIIIIIIIYKVPGKRDER